MTTIRRILCPLDFSRFSRHALDQAVALARETGAEISVLHVFTFAPVAQSVAAGAAIPMEPMRLDPAMRMSLLSDMATFVDDVDTAGITITQTLFEGDAVTRILDRATDWNADLIVMGTHGRSGFERMLLGSVTEKVLRKAACPVLTVPPRVLHATPGLSFARVLCPIDFSPASLRALEYASAVAAPNGPGIVALNVIELFAEGGGTRDELALDTPDFRAGLRRTALARLHDAVRDTVRATCPIAESVTLGKAWKEILQVASQEEIDLIVMGVAGRSAADLLLFGSTTQHVVRQAACPVLTIRA